MGERLRGMTTAQRVVLVVALVGWLACIAYVLVPFDSERTALGGEVVSYRCGVAIQIAVDPPEGADRGGQNCVSVARARVMFVGFVGVVAVPCALLVLLGMFAPKKRDEAELDGVSRSG